MAARGLRTIFGGRFQISNTPTLKLLQTISLSGPINAAHREYPDWSAERQGGHCYRESKFAQSGCSWLFVETRERSSAFEHGHMRPERPNLKQQLATVSGPKFCDCSRFFEIIAVVRRPAYHFEGPKREWPDRLKISHINLADAMSANGGASRRL